MPRRADSEFVRGLLAALRIVTRELSEWQDAEPRLRYGACQATDQLRWYIEARIARERKRG